MPAPDDELHELGSQKLDAMHEAQARGDGASGHAIGVQNDDGSTSVLVSDTFTSVGEASQRVIDDIRAKMSEGKIFMGAPVYYVNEVCSDNATICSHGDGRNKRRAARQLSIFK